MISVPKEACGHLSHLTSNTPNARLNYGIALPSLGISHLIYIMQSIALII